MSSDLREFKLGQLHGFIDSDSGQLRYLRIGKYELLRGIYGSVRRPDWGTVVQKVHDFKLDRQAESFACSFVAVHKDDKMDFTWTGKISGKVVGGGQIEIEYELEGVVPVDQKTNRLGLCVLHPSNLKGVPATIEHSNGSKETIDFPKFIKPDQPFKDTKAISYRLGDGIGFRIELSGDNFETEDQRNYGDASFKTYCHWQESGSPYPVTKGQVISQRARLIINPEALHNPEPVPTMTEGNLPSLGTLFRRTMSIPEMDQLTGLHMTHAMCTTEGIESAKLIGGPVFLQTDQLIIPNELAPNDGILYSKANDVEKLNALRGARRFLAARSWFIEMNGARPKLAAVEGVSLGMHPKTHQFDTETMMEMAWVLPDQAESARNYGAQTIIAGPIRLSDSPDLRTNGIEAALVALASIVNGVKAYADYVTLFDAETLLTSPAMLPIALMAERHSNKVRVWDFEPDFVMIECGKLIFANLSWEATDIFKHVDFDSLENRQVGIKGEYHLFDQSNVVNWRKVLRSPAKHGTLSAFPPRSIVVLG